MLHSSSLVESRGSIASLYESLPYVDTGAFRISPFTYFKRSEALLLVVVILLNMAGGMAQGFYNYFYGEIIHSWAIGSFGAKYYEYLGYGAGLLLLAFILNAIGGSLQEILAERQINAIRLRCMYSILSQDHHWLSHNSIGLSGQIEENCRHIRHGTGVTFSKVCSIVGMAMSGYLFGFLQKWKVCLMVVSVVPILIACSIVTTLWERKHMKVLDRRTAQTVGLFEESLGAIKTVAAFGLQQRLLAKITTFLDGIRHHTVKAAWLDALGAGLIWAVILGFEGFIIFYSSNLVARDIDQHGADVCAAANSPCYTGGKAMGVILVTMMPAYCFGTIASGITSVIKAQMSMKQIKDLLRTESVLNIMDEVTGMKPTKSLTGQIKFNSVTFHYPKPRIMNEGERQKLLMDPPTLIFKEFSLTIQPGATTAIVGPSGSGKSTLIQLLCRLYDPQGGEILVDGMSLQSLNLRWYRNNIAIISQEPRLFNSSITENIRVGRLDANMDEIVEASKQANAYSFIETLPNKFETNVGRGASQLSGGQKQRIAIARALLRHPAILILDEATSALDVESERLVQTTLDSFLAGKKRTTIVIAHRLSTIRKADRIVVLGKNREGLSAVVEDGSHEELVNLNGIYASMLRDQTQTLAGNMSSPPEIEAPDVRTGPFCQSERERKTDSQKQSTMSNNSNVKNFQIDREVGGRPDPGDKDDLKQNTIAKGSLRRIWRGLRTMKWLLFLAILGVFLQSLVSPALGFLFGRMITRMNSPDTDVIRRSGRQGLAFFGIIAICQLIFVLFEHGFCSQLSSKLRRRTQIGIFKSLLYQDIEYFDSQSHKIGLLSEVFNKHTLQMAAWTGIPMGDQLQAVFSLGVALVAALIQSWAIALVSLVIWAVIIPVSVIGGRGLMEDAGAEDRPVYISDGNGSPSPAVIMDEALDNALTINQFTIGKKVYLDYKHALDDQSAHLTRNGIRTGTLWACLTIVSFASEIVLVFCVGWIIKNHSIEVEKAMTAMNTLGFMAWGFSRAASTVAETKDARQSSGLVFNILDDKATIHAALQAADEADCISKNPPPHPIQLGENGVSFQDVYFAYPERLEKPVYQKLQLSIKPGDTVAFVGASGCGKSTIIQLLERFYDAEGIYYNGQNIRNIDLRRLRASISWVPQEPFLFNTTIEENIAMGSLTPISPEDTVKAANFAGAYDMIQSLDGQFGTEVGKGGSRLSGGQKQRVAIARALIRKPAILVLDEATSALDTESEKVVQESIDRLIELNHRADHQNRMTVIMIAHRLSTVRNCDKIYVFKNEGAGGLVVEAGSHQELLGISNGVYKSMINNSS